jgi:lipoprotein NlpI
MNYFFMRRLVFAATFVVSAMALISAQGAQTADPRLREAFLTGQTNHALAIAICDKAVADAPTNAEPLAVRARLHDLARQYDNAVRDLSAALKLEPRSTRFWQARGEVHFRAGRFKESVADFDKVLEFSPEQAPHHWQRGISLYYAGRFVDGRKQFESHRAVNPNDVENAAWHFLCAARESGVTNARAIMLPVGKDGRAPMPEIDAFYRGTGTAENVMAVATRAMSDPRQQSAVFYAHLYLGLYFDLTGHAAKAREHISKAANDPEAHHYMGDVARVHLRQLSVSR